MDKIVCPICGKSFDLTDPQVSHKTLCLNTKSKSNVFVFKDGLLTYNIREIARYHLEKGIEHLWIDQKQNEDLRPRWKLVNELNLIRSVIDQAKNFKKQTLPVREYSILNSFGSIDLVSFNFKFWKKQFKLHQRAISDLDKSKLV